MAAQKPSVKIKNDTCPMAVVNRHVKQQILFSFESPHDRISAKPSCSHRKYRFCLVSLTIQNLHVSKSKHAVPNPPVCQCSPMRTDIRAGSIYPVAPLSCREAARRVAHGGQLDARRASSNHRQVPHGALVPRDCLGALVVDALQLGDKLGQPVLGEDGGYLLPAAEGKLDPGRGQV